MDGAELFHIRKMVGVMQVISLSNGFLTLVAWMNLSFTYRHKSWIRVVAELQAPAAGISTVYIYLLMIMKFTK